MAGPTTGKHKPGYVTFSQDLAPEFWQGWDPALIIRGDARAIVTEVVRRHEAATGKPVPGAWGVVHDRDMAADNKTLRGAHLHCVLQQNTAGGLFCPDIDKALGFAGSVVRAPGRGARVENAQSYLIHAKDDDKFPYDRTLVATVRGRDYLEIEESFRVQWARRRVIGRQAAVTAKEWSELADALIQKVLDGEIDESDLLLDKTLRDIYARNEAPINSALSVRYRSEMYAEVQRFRAEVFRTMVIWIMGARQQGKSWMAEEITKHLEKALGWRTFRSTARNGPDDYAGQQVFWLNEPSTKVMEWSDLLTLFDANQAGPISARYRNKGDAAPRVVIVSVSIDPASFGFFVPGKRSTDDSLDQLLGRITLQVTAQKLDGVPRYAISQMDEVAVYRRSVQLPARNRHERENPDYEVLELTYGPRATVDGLPMDVALDALVGEIMARSTDVEFVPAGSSLAELHTQQNLAARGIHIAGPVRALTAA